MFVHPLAAVAERLAELRSAEAAERAAGRAAVVPILAALLAGEPLSPTERGAILLEVLRGWRASAFQIPASLSAPRPPGVVMARNRTLP